MGALISACAASAEGLLAVEQKGDGELDILNVEISPELFENLSSGEKYPFLYVFDCDDKSSDEVGYLSADGVDITSDDVMRNIGHTKYQVKFGQSVMSDFKQPCAQIRAGGLLGLSSTESNIVRVKSQSSTEAQQEVENGSPE